MQYKQRLFVYNQVASAWLNVTHDECHGFFCPFQITDRHRVKGLEAVHRPGGTLLPYS